MKHYFYSYTLKFILQPLGRFIYKLNVHFIIKSVNTRPIPKHKTDRINRLSAEIEEE